MKIRNGFVSNSSSCSFTIHNLTDRHKTLVDFVKENPELLDDFLREYDWYSKEAGYTLENMIKGAKARNIKFRPRQSKVCIFGDEQGDIIGAVYDYQLRYGGKSKSFRWNFKEMLR